MKKTAASECLPGSGGAPVRRAATFSETLPTLCGCSLPSCYCSRSGGKNGSRLGKTGSLLVCPNAIGSVLFDDPRPARAVLPADQPSREPTAPLIAPPATRPDRSLRRASWRYELCSLTSSTICTMDSCRWLTSRTSSPSRCSARLRTYFATVSQRRTVRRDEHHLLGHMHVLTLSQHPSGPMSAALWTWSGCISHPGC